MEYLLLNINFTFCIREQDITELCGKSVLKVKRIKLDYELAIHAAFEPVFKLSGCYFHFSQVS